MSRGRAVLNRVGLAVTGMALCLLGGGALLRGAGVFGPGAAARPVVGGDVAEFARDRLWFWPSLAAGGFLLAVAGLWWLVSRLRPDQVRRVRLRAGMGLVEVAGAPVGRVVAAQVCAHPRIRRARAVVRGSSRRPWLDLRLSASGGAPVGEVLALVGERALPGLRAALALERLPAVVRLSVDRRGCDRSHVRGLRRPRARAVHRAH
jgi:hypothetical protein